MSAQKHIIMGLSVSARKHILCAFKLTLKGPEKAVQPLLSLDYLPIWPHQKFLDSHPNFVKNLGGLEVFIFYFLTALKNRIVLKKS